MSNINPTNINTLYPIAGQDNDTQGFRTNFSNIVNNFSIAKTEITALQGVVAAAPSTIASPPLQSTSIGTVGQLAYDANYLYFCVGTNTWSQYTSNWGTGSSTVANITVNTTANVGNLVVNGTTSLANLTQTQVAAISSPKNGMMVYNYTFSNVQVYTTHLGKWGNLTLS
jgi:hypothetical protein